MTGGSNREADAPASKPRAFVLMPFDDEFKAVYDKVIREKLEEAGFEVHRADDLLHQQNILSTIVNSIAQSELIVADLTALNANVFYELGIAHALAKKVILLTQDIKELPFDLRSYKVIPYDVHFERIESFKKELFDTAVGAMRGDVAFRNPVTDFIKPQEARTESVSFSTTWTPESREPISSRLEEGERGFWDHLVALEEGFGRLMSTTDDIVQATELVSAGLKRGTREINKAVENRSFGSASHVRKIIRKVAHELEEYSDRLRAGNDQFTSASGEIDESMNYIVNLQEPETEEERQKLSEVLTSIADSQRAMKSLIDSIAGLQSAFALSKGAERQLDRAIQLTERELGRLIDNTNMIIATYSRVKNLVTQKLELN